VSGSLGFAPCPRLDDLRWLAVEAPPPFSVTCKARLSSHMCVHVPKGRGCSSCRRRGIPWARDNKQASIARCCALRVWYGTPLARLGKVSAPGEERTSAQYSRSCRGVAAATMEVG